eukprot:6204721-Pleurochrysis_carterae.AAC.3
MYLNFWYHGGCSVCTVHPWLNHVSELAARPVDPAAAATPRNAVSADVVDATRTPRRSAAPR